MFDPEDKGELDANEFKTILPLMGEEVPPEEIDLLFEQVHKPERERWEHNQSSGHLVLVIADTNQSAGANSMRWSIFSVGGVHIPKIGRCSGLIRLVDAAG